ncbi:hypothetical protein F2Q69_00002585 [Brassica cretica]|uniref:X8 domain-containing protein n=1 Tax=Brassica cretica TaxID=69181 RepID=A0A8S9NQ06_BRACR|nr:hypothetical protein F2Q69_00002585 [Brassica cretica]
MDWLKSLKSFIFAVHLHVQGKDNHHGGTDSLWLASPPIHQRRRLFSTRYESRQPSGTWCVANPKIQDQVVQAALGWACQQSQAYCSRIQLGQNCYSPNTLRDHASVVFNTYYQHNKDQGGSCDFNRAAVITHTDPSHDTCQFESVPDSNNERKASEWCQGNFGTSCPRAMLPCNTYNIDEHEAFHTFITSKRPTTQKFETGVN